MWTSTRDDFARQTKAIKTMCGSGVSSSRGAVLTARIQLFLWLEAGVSKKVPQTRNTEKNVNLFSFGVSSLVDASSHSFS